MNVLDQWIRMYARSRMTLVRSRVVEPWGFRLDPGAMIAFHLVWQGTAWLRRAGEAPLRLEEGDLVVLSDGKAHDLVASPKGEAPPVSQFVQQGFDVTSQSPDAVIFCGRFQVDGTRRLGQSALPPCIHLPAAELRKDNGILPIVLLLAEELEHQGLGNESLVESLADSLLVYVLRRAAERAGHSAGWLPAMKDPNLAKVFRAIHADPAAKWTVEGMAKVAGLSRAAFARRFHDRAGEPPLTYLKGWRLTLAARKLASGPTSVGSLASEAGYASEAAFTRAFKDYHGLAPRAYLQTLQSGARLPDGQAIQELRQASQSA
ncbi:MULTISPECIES: AraC family transcriptional regulator [unclassified Devosia]|uniref:AraC family transcriptional regulator n=1 Tax=unclassified Devosia TaxID=196773 RepID=UPI0015532E63|nr:MULTISPECIES: AraC family transcriptional regulator [unclassified Devosia]